jgi:Ulp1 protease family, C-terminal catalytic domain
MSICSPHINSSFTCFDNEMLVRIAQMCNDKFGTNININNKGKKLWKAINDTMIKQRLCNDYDEVCWSTTFKLPNDEHFKPERPKGKHTWLNTSDINRVMEQYEKKYKDFVFIGAIPRDFFMILDEFSKRGMDKLSKKAKRIGMIFNTDKHDQSGSHWLAVFIDLNTKSIEYFDSTGRKPVKDIDEFIKQVVINAYMNLGIELKKKINKKEHQLQDSECGVYSLYYIIQRLKGRTFENITNNIIRDKEMNKCRETFFRP